MKRFLQYLTPTLMIVIILLVAFDRVDSSKEALSDKMKQLNITIEKGSKKVRSLSHLEDMIDTLPNEAKIVSIYRAKSGTYWITYKIGDRKYLASMEFGYFSSNLTSNTSL